MENKFTERTPVLNEKGHPIPGWADEGLLDYNRKKIKAPFYRIKEWDFYQISDERMCLQFTFGHASYAGNVGCMLFDFRKGERYSVPDKLIALPFNRLHLPNHAEKDHILSYHSSKISMRIVVKNGNRRILCSGNGFKADIRLKQLTPKSLLINIPFDESKKAFYCNQKINCMKACGTVSWPGGSYTFDQDAWGLLDWGRGVWPFHNEWFWSNGSGTVREGGVFGFNLGCGFGNTSAATENVLFYNGETHKLGPVTFELDPDDYEKPWYLSDQEGRLHLTLTPTYDRTTRTKLLWVDNECHQMFGDFVGTVVLDNDTTLHIDHIVSFAEHARNNW